jgi:hypothetical protein
MRRYVLLLPIILAPVLFAASAYALDKVDPYICPTKLQGSGLDCFLEAIPQTYTMCRHIKGIEIIEFGMTGAQEGVNGAKTEYCIDKHRLLITRPYQAALRESANSKDAVEGLRKLHDMWLDSLAKLIPVAGETDDVYKQRVVLPYRDFTEQTTKIRASVEAAAKPAAPATSKPKKKTSK